MQSGKNHFSSSDVFATSVAILTATNGTVFVQSDGREVYGVFTCEGRGWKSRLAGSVGNCRAGRAMSE
jgi:hypothetical protein